MTRYVILLCLMMSGCEKMYSSEAMGFAEAHGMKQPMYTANIDNVCTHDKHNDVTAAVLVENSDGAVVVCMGDGPPSFINPPAGVIP